MDNGHMKTVQLDIQELTAIPANVTDAKERELYAMRGQVLRLRAENIALRRIILNSGLAAQMLDAEEHALGEEGLAFAGRTVDARSWTDMYDPNLGAKKENNGNGKGKKK